MSHREIIAFALGGLVAVGAALFAGAIGLSPVAACGLTPARECSRIW